MKISFSIQAWEEYLYFQSQDKKTLKKINQLIILVDYIVEESMTKID
jgi:hypothetical protein